MEKALEKDPENSYINYKLGLGFYLQRQFDKAIFYLGQSVSFNSTSDKADTFYHLGTTDQACLTRIWSSSTRPSIS